MVLVPFEHVARALHVGFQPGGVVSQRAALAQVVVHAVRLDVGFVVDVEPVFVAQLVEFPVLGVVAEPHGVEVVSFHQLEVAAHHLLRDVVSRHGMVFVDVHALELHGLPVHQQYAVGLAVFGPFVQPGELETAEPYAVGHRFGLPAGAAEGHQQGVEIGALRAPGLDAGDAGLEPEGAASAGCDHCVALPCRDLPARVVEQLVAQRRFGIAFGSVGQIGLQGEYSVPACLVERRFDAEVPHGDARLRPEEHVALDAAHAPEVLTFEPGAGAPAVDLYGQRVPSGPEVFVDEELRGVLRILVVACLVSVHIDIYARLGSCEVQEYVTVVPFVRNFELPAVYPCGIHLGEPGRLGTVGRELVLMVGVYGRPEPLALPVPGHFDVIPPRGVGRGVRGVGGQIAGILGEEKLPRAVERQIEGALLVAHGQRPVPRGIGHEVGAGRDLVHRHGLYVVPVGVVGSGGLRRQQRERCQDIDSRVHVIWFCRF